MKNLIILLIAILGSKFANSQKKDGFRVGLDLGYAIPASGGGGLIFTIEPKYNIADNMNVGLKIGAAALVKEINSNNGIATKAKIGVVAFYTGTFDYYFHKSRSDFAPFVGGGISYNGLANVEVDNNNSGNPAPVLDVNTKFGGLLMGGFEYQHFRMALEYNYIPESNLQNNFGIPVGKISNSYFGINFGFYIGGGKWGK